MSDDRDDAQAEIARLNKIIQVLMDRAERSTDLQGTDFNLFQTAVMLDQQVKSRTAELEKVLRDNERINRALRESEAKYRALVDQSLVGIGIIDDGRFSFVNPQFCEIFGRNAEEMTRLGPMDVTCEQDRPRVEEQMRRRMSGEVDRVHYQLRGLRKDGVQLEIEVYGNIAEVGGRRVMVSVVLDVTERCRTERELLALQERLRDQSLHDPLTGLYNRRYMDEALERELLLAARSPHPVSLIMADLDHFKQVNDLYGHPTGDRVLKAFADLLRALSRATDIDCRFGGEEFLLVLPGMDKADAFARAERLREAVSAGLPGLGGCDIPVTASFGIAAFPVDGSTAVELIAAADAALYAAKEVGRNRVVQSLGVH